MWWLQGAAVLHAIVLLSTFVSTGRSAEPCLEQICVVRAGRLLNAMNSEVDPCKNFAEFACGGTFQEDRTLGLDSSVGTAQRESTTIDFKLNKAFKTDIPKWSPQAPETKALKFFQGCKRSWFSRAHALQLLHSMAVGLGVPDLLQWSRRRDPGATLPTTTTFGGALRMLREQFGVRLIPSVLRMQVDRKCFHVVQFGELVEMGTDLDLESLNFFKNPEEREDLNTMKENYVELTTREACINTDEDKFQDISLGDLIKAAPTFGWPEFLNLKDNSSMVEIGPCIPEMSRQLASIMDEYPQLTKKFLISLAMKNLWTRRDIDTVDNNCFALMKRYFVEVLTSIVKNHESVPNVQPVARMTDQMRSALARRMERADWLDPATRDQYLDKLRNLRVHIGYPDVADDSAAMHRFHSSLEVTGTLPKDLIRVARWREEMSSSRCDLDIWEQLIHPLEPNAFNVPLLQSVAISLGQIRADNYDHRLPSSVNYAGIGMTIGHEMMHSFDSSGRTRTRWFKDVEPAESTGNYLDEGEACLVEYYNTLEVRGVQVNGTTTLGENIADVYGLMLAYESWQEEQRSTGPDTSLPGLAYTPEQIFFISFAQANCDRQDKDTLEYLKTGDVHSPGYARVLGSAAQSREFAAAFSCPTEELPKRCKLW